MKDGKIAVVEEGAELLRSIFWRTSNFAAEDAEGLSYRIQTARITDLVKSEHQMFRFHKFN